MAYDPPRKPGAQISQYVQRDNNQISTASEVEILDDFGHVKEWRGVEGHLMHVLRTLKLKMDELTSPITGLLTGRSAVHLSGESL